MTATQQQHNAAKPRRAWGKGSITTQAGRKRVRVRVNGKRRDIGYFDDEGTAERVLNAVHLSRDVREGITLRLWGEVYLESIRDHRAIRSTTNTWRSVILDAPFVDYPLDELSLPLINNWASKVLPYTRK